MTKKTDEQTGKMTRIRRKIVHVNIKWSILNRVDVLKRFFRFVWGSIVGCSCAYQFRNESNSPSRYRRLGELDSDTIVDEVEIVEFLSGYETDSDLVHLKISLLGDCQIGKTSFLERKQGGYPRLIFVDEIKYVGEEQERKSLEMKGLNLMDKVIVVQGARIASTIWDVAGDLDSQQHIPIACKDAVAILFMFDLTSRCTLNGVIEWYNQARKWNKTAIPILIGTKFDDFVRLPPDLQWTIVTQARGYAKAMKATLFFSSATHNINVNKIFKFIMAKLFNLPWSVQRNLTAGEPIVDY